jgi:acetyltransferase-like isoleucine patch superfamily enzyme
MSLPRHLPLEARDRIMKGFDAILNWNPAALFELRPEQGGRVFDRGQETPGEGELMSGIAHFGDFLDGWEVGDDGFAHVVPARRRMEGTECPPDGSWNTLQPGEEVFNKDHPPPEYIRFPVLGNARIHPSARIGGRPESRDFEGEPIPLEIHRTAEVHAFVTVDCGTIRPTHIGARSVLMHHSHVGHDIWVGDDVELSTGVILGGFDWIGDGVRIGINATVLPRQHIGAGARIGAGAVVTKDVPPGETWIGNPARKL